MFLRKSKLRYTFLISCFITLLLVCLSFSFGEPNQDDLDDATNYPLQLPSSSLSPTSTDPVQRSKVFVIGLSKTGTTSVGDALSRLCFHRLGWEDIRSRFLFRSYLRGNISPFISLTQYYDAFEDLPWALVYQDMARLYPDAKFILTMRANEQDWLTSIKGHTARRKWIGHDFVYGASRAEGHEGSYLEAYRNHTSSVRSFFAAEGNETRLLEWVIGGKDMTEKAEDGKWGILLRFLGMEDSEEIRDELGEFPWTNRTDSWRDKKFMKIMWWTWDMIMYYLEEASLRVLECLGWLAGGMS
jgi:hypothetical protein